MPGYIKKSLQKYQYDPSLGPKYAPHAWNPPKYGARIQNTPKPDSSPTLDENETKYVQSVVGSFRQSFRWA